MWILVGLGACFVEVLRTSYEEILISGLKTGVLMMLFVTLIKR